MLGKRVRDSVGWGIHETKADDVVQGLAGNVARSTSGDESGGASWCCGWSRCRHLILVIVWFNNGKCVGLLHGTYGHFNGLPS